MSAELLLKDVHVQYPVFTSGSQQSVLTAAAYMMSFGAIRRSKEGIQIVEALNGVNIRLRPGARVGLIGRNGAGKSTLLRVMAGIHWPSRGTRLVNGSIGSLLTALTGLDGEKSGRQNVKFICRVFGYSPTEVDSIIEDITNFTELGGFFDMPLRTYSAGMQVRLSFALATALPCEILLIDEALGAGDAHFLKRASERLMNLSDRASISVLATHSYGDLENFCNYAIRLERGQIVDAGDPAEVWGRYIEGDTGPTKLKRIKSVAWPPTE